MKRISGRNIALTLDPSEIDIVFEEVSLSIEDASTVAMSMGRPDGWVDGEIKASGEVALDSYNFNLLIAACTAEDGFKGLPAQTITFYANVGDNAEDQLSIIAHDCKFSLKDILKADQKGGAKLKHTIPFIVTGKDFVSINGIPYEKLNA